MLDDNIGPSLKSNVHCFFPKLLASKADIFPSNVLTNNKLKRSSNHKVQKVRTLIFTDNYCDNAYHETIICE